MLPMATERVAYKQISPNASPQRTSALARDMCYPMALAEETFRDGSFPRWMIFDADFNVVTLCLMVF